MSERVCPWWLGYLLASPIRKFWYDPRRVLAPLVREGQRALEPGPGMGFFTLELARLVGPNGRVVAIDLQPKMIERLKRRVTKADLADRVDARVVSADSLGIGDLNASIDFILAFAVVHEVPDAAKFFREVAASAKQGATMLVAEPRGHVKDAMFEGELKLAAEAGFRVIDRPAIPHSLTAYLKKAS
ncbi:MAG TPA: class I SAM-dependent methyltransferase [Dongiaceae bacterium]|nr:class I SAM-dependent methyltransferase [Dongiaceae bacterium]